MENKNAHKNPASEMIVLAVTLVKDKEMNHAYPAINHTGDKIPATRNNRFCSLPKIIAGLKISEPLKPSLYTCLARNIPHGIIKQVYATMVI
jgi:hypothetical protein